MTETTDDEQRDRRRIAAADPAAGLPPLPAIRLDALLEDAMTTPVDASTPAPAPAPRRPRFRRAVIGVAAAVLLLGGGTAVVLSQQSDPVPTAASTALTLPDTGGIASACAVLTPEFLAASPVAFAAQVESIADGTVTLRVTERFTGTITDTVTVAQGTNSGVDGEALSFESGGRYLIAVGEGGVISTCGGSGPDSAELRALYAQAFPR